MTRTIDPDSPRQEVIIRGRGPTADGFPDAVSVRIFASKETGARGLCTASAEFGPQAALPAHYHDCGEAITVVRGKVQVVVEDRSYRLDRLDCIFIPAGARHAVSNPGNDPVQLHTAFASAEPQRAFVPAQDGKFDRPTGGSGNESVARFQDSPAYELATNAEFRDLFAGRLGASGICGGYGAFQPGAGLPCHLHDYDESITIVSGEAVCEVEGARYLLRGMDTALVPRGRAHRFLNASSEPMAMIWVYAGDEPQRTILDCSRCTGHR